MRAPRRPYGNLSVSLETGCAERWEMLHPIHRMGLDRALSNPILLKPKVVNYLKY